MVFEADAQQPIQHLSRELRSMPDVGNLEARHEGERIGPIGARIAGDRGFGVTSGALLQVAWLGRAVAVEACAIAPLRVEFDPVGRIGNHEPWLTLAQQARHGFRVRRVSAQHAMRPQEPEIAGPRHWRFRQRRCRVGLFLVVKQKQFVDFARDRNR